jgi:hypothetical protein
MIPACARQPGFLRTDHPRVGHSRSKRRLAPNVLDSKLLQGVLRGCNSLSGIVCLGTRGRRIAGERDAWGDNGSRLCNLHCALREVWPLDTYLGGDPLVNLGSR